MRLLVDILNDTADRLDRLAEQDGVTATALWAVVQHSPRSDQLADEIARDPDEIRKLAESYRAAARAIGSES